MSIKIIGERLRTLRESVGKTQAFIASEIGTVAQSAIFATKMVRAMYRTQFCCGMPTILTYRSTTFSGARTSRRANYMTITPKPSMTRRCSSL